MRNKVIIKVNYNLETGEVIGYYPSFLNYKNIPKPNIEIEDGDHSKYLGKRMVVKDGVFQEYKEPQKEILKQKQALLISSRGKYLRSTDWYLTREQDEPNSYPSEIKAKRILARREINEIEACKTLKQLNNYQLNFNLC